HIIATAANVRRQRSGRRGRADLLGHVGPAAKPFPASASIKSQAFLRCSAYRSVAFSATGRKRPSGHLRQPSSLWPRQVEDLRGPETGAPKMKIATAAATLSLIGVASLFAPSYSRAQDVPPSVHVPQSQPIQPNNIRSVPRNTSAQFVAQP